MKEKTYACGAYFVFCAGCLIASSPSSLHARFEYKAIISVGVGYASIRVSNFIADMIESARRGVAGDRHEAMQSASGESDDIAVYFDASQWPAPIKDVFLPVFNKYIEVSIVDLINKLMQAGGDLSGFNPNIPLIVAVWKFAYKIPTVPPALSMLSYLKEIFERSGVEDGLKTMFNVLLGVVYHFNALTLARFGAQTFISEKDLPIAFKTLERLFETIGLLVQTAGGADAQAVGSGVKTSKAGWAIGKTAPAAIEEIVE